MRRLLMLCANYPWWSLALLLLLSLLAATQLHRVHVQISTEELLLIDDPERDYYERVSQQFGDEKIILLYLQDEQLMAPDKLALLQKVIADIGKLPFVDRVESLFSVPYVKSIDGYLNKDPYLVKLPKDLAAGDEIRKRALQDPFVRNVLLSADGRVMSAAIVLKSGVSGVQDLRITRDINQLIQPLVSHYQKVFAIGYPYVRTAIAQQIQAEQSRLFPFAVGALLIALFLMLRQVVDILAPVMSATVSILWTLGLMGATGIPLNVVTSIVPILLIIVGSTEDIHLLSEFRHAQRRGLRDQAAIKQMSDRMGRTVLLTFITTYAGFFSVGLSRIEVLWQFGIIASTGLLFNFIATVVLIPAVLSLAGRWQLDGRSRFIRAAPGQLAETYWRGLNRHRWGILVVLVACTLAAALGVPRIQVNHSTVESLGEGSEVRREVEAVNRNLAGLEDFSIIVESGIQDTFLKARYLEEVEKIQHFIEQQGLARSTTSFTNYLSLLNMAFQEIERPVLPASDDVVNELMIFLDYKHVKAYVSKDYSRVRILVRHGADSTEELQSFVDTVQQYIDTHLDPGLRAHITGSSVLTLSATKSMIDGQLKSVLLLLVFFILIISIIFAGLRVGLLAALPNAFPVIVLFGFMGYADIPLNIGTTMAAAIAIGIAVDDTLHFMLRYNQELKSSHNQVKAMHATLAAESLPMISTSVALIAGFLVFTLSDFQPIVLFGQLSALVIASALLADFVITPLAISSLRLVNLWDLLSAQLRKDLIPRSVLFRGMRPWQIRRFILASSLIDYAQGESVFEPGSDSMAMYLVIKGEIEVHVPEKGAQGRDLVVSRFGPGELFGDVAVLADTRRKTRAVACGPTTLLVLGRDTIYNVVNYHPFIASRIFYNLSTDVSRRWIRFIGKVEPTEVPPAKPDDAGAKNNNQDAAALPGEEK